MKRLNFISIFFALIISCVDKSDLTNQPTEQQTVIVAVKTPTVPLPIPNPTATQTQNPPQVDFSQPVLLHIDFRANNSIIALSTDGYSQSVLQLPQGGCLRNGFRQALSPRGHWLAYYTGCEDPKNVRLNLLHLPNSEVYPVANLISKEAVNVLLDINFDDVYFLDWSLDGRYLAFGGAIETSSIELYIFDMEEQSIRRLTDGLNSLEFLDWSPNEDWILLSNSVLEGSASREYFYAVQSFGAGVQKPVLLFDGRYVLTENGWLSSSRYFFVTASEGCCGPNNLRYFDVETNQEKRLWMTSITGFAIDRENRKVIVNSAPEADVTGVFIIEVDGNTRKISDEIFWDFSFRGGQYSRFVGFDDRQVVAISEDGKIKQISDKSHSEISVSPDRNWFVLYDSLGRKTGIELFSETDEFVRRISVQDGVPVAWSPDSTGLFYITDALYYIEIPDGEPVPIQTCEPEGCYDEGSFTWSFP